MRETKSNARHQVPDVPNGDSLPNLSQPSGTSETAELRVTLRGLLTIALTKRKVSLGGKEVAERVDTQAALRIVELQIRLVELERPSYQLLLTEIMQAPDNIASAWLELNRYLFAAKAHRSRAKTPS